MGWISITDTDDSVVGVVGDEPWDIMADAFDKIFAAYSKAWGRNPNAFEMEQVFEFVLNGRFVVDAE